METLADLRDIDRPAELRAHVKVVDPDRGAGCGLHRIGRLRHDHETHVLQHRNDGRKRHRVAGVIDLEVEGALVRVDAAVEVHGDAVRAHLLHALDVRDRQARAETLLVVGGYRGGVAAVQRHPAAFAILVRERLPELVVPAVGSLHQEFLDCLRVARGSLAVGRVDDKMRPRHRRVRDLGLHVDGFPLELAQQDCFHSPPEIRGVVLARNEHEARDKLSVRVAAQEQSHPLAVFEVQDAVGEFLELIDIDLEQFVARQGVEDVLERLGVVAARRKARTFDDRGHLAPQQGDLLRARAVGGRGQKSQEAALPRHASVGVEPANADVVHVDGAMDLRARPRLGGDEELLALEIAREPVWQRRGMARPAFLAHLAQDTEVPVLDDAGIDLVVPAFEGVFAVAEEGEMVVAQPLQEIEALGKVVLGDRRYGFQLGDLAVEFGGHGPPVLDGGANAGQHLVKPRCDFRVTLAGRLLGNLDMEHGFGSRPVGCVRCIGPDPARKSVLPPDMDDRMDQHENGKVQGIESGDDGIDEERHVVVDDLDGRVGRLPAVLLEIGVVGADFRPGTLALPEELPERGDPAVEVLGRLALEILGDDVGVEASGEPGNQFGVVAEAGANQGENLVDLLVQELAVVPVHVASRNGSQRRNLQGRRTDCNLPGGLPGSTDVPVKACRETVNDTRVRVGHRACCGSVQEAFDDAR